MAGVDVLARCTPRMRAVLATTERLATEVGVPGDDLAARRASYDAEHRYWNEGGPAMARTVERTVPTPYGAVRVREQHPAPEHDPAAGHVVYLHGGGFVLGGLDSHDRIVRTLAAGTGARVTAVDYTLSPEARHPQAVHECAAVVRDVAVAGEGPVALAGDSAGAHLALATALHLADRDGPALGPLLLWYGLYGLRDSVSRRLLGGPWDGLTPADLAGYVAAYLGDEADDPAVDLLAADLSALPPVYLAATDLDPLLDDSVALARLLGTAGVPHRLQVFPGVLHAFLHCSRDLPEARAALAAGAEFHAAHRRPRAGDPRPSHPSREAPRWTSD